MHTVAHVRSATAIHVTRFDISCGETEVCELDNDFAFTTTVRSGDETICNDEIFRFNVTMEDLLGMASGNGITHLREHG